MNVQMRIITDANAASVTNLAFSKHTVGDLSLSAGAPAAAPKAKEKGEVLREEEEEEDLRISRADLGAEARPQDIGWGQSTQGSGPGWSSLILDDGGEPTQHWPLAEHSGEDPTAPPSGWVSDQARLDDGAPIAPALLSSALASLRVPGNWPRAVQKVKEDAARRPREGETVIAPPSTAATPPAGPAPGSPVPPETLGALEDVTEALEPSEEEGSALKLLTDVSEKEKKEGAEEGSKAEVKSVKLN